MRKVFSLAIAAAAAGSVFSDRGFVQPAASGSRQQHSQPVVERREALLGSMAVLAGLAAGSQNAEAYMGPRPIFEGKYSDPEHAGCKRIITKNLRQYILEAEDGFPECQFIGNYQKGSATVAPPIKWTAIGRDNPDNNTQVIFDFSNQPKDPTLDFNRNKTRVVATWDFTGLRFPDGGKWFKLGGVRRFRREEEYEEDPDTMRSYSIRGLGE